jgi:hypothetical protein
MYSVVCVALLMIRQKTDTSPREPLSAQPAVEQGQITHWYDQIFDAFFKTKPEGSGVGLAISKSVVESQGGRIWASGDDRCGGAMFHFTLAAAPAETNPAVDAA